MASWHQIIVVLHCIKNNRVYILINIQRVETQAFYERSYVFAEVCSNALYPFILIWCTYKNTNLNILYYVSFVHLTVEVHTTPPPSDIDIDTAIPKDRFQNGKIDVDELGIVDQISKLFTVWC